MGVSRTIITFYFLILFVIYGCFGDLCGFLLKCYACSGFLWKGGSANRMHPNTSLIESKEMSIIKSF